MCENPVPLFDLIDQNSEKIKDDTDVLILFVYWFLDAKGYLLMKKDEVRDGMPFQRIIYTFVFKSLFWSSRQMERTWEK